MILDVHIPGHPASWRIPRLLSGSRDMPILPQDAILQAHSAYYTRYEPERTNRYLIRNHLSLVYIWRMYS